MFNPFSLKNKVIVITGASSGIGKQCAISCSKMGAKIILIARNSERLSNVMNELDGKEHVMHSFDVTNYDGIETIIKDSVEKLGKIDGFIHSAGIELTKPLKVMKSTDYEALFAVNAIAGFEFVKNITKKKYSNNGASFVFISSIMGIVGNSALVSYCASKGALISGVRALAIEYANKNIRFNSIIPGHLADTEMSIEKNKKIGQEALGQLISLHPLGLGSKEDVANASIYLLSDASRWITGTNLIIDGGYSAK